SGAPTQLFVAPVDGSAAGLQLAPEGDGNVSFTADSAKVVFPVVYSNYFTYAEIWSVPRDGSAPPVRLASSAAVGCVFDDCTAFYRLTSTRIVYLDMSSNGIHSAPLDRSAPPVSLGYASGSQYGPSPDGSRVVFVAPNRSLFSVPSDGSAAAIDLAHVGSPSSWVTEFRIAPDGTWVAYLAGPDLYSVPIDGSALPVQLTANGFSRSVNRFEI